MIRILQWIVKAYYYNLHGLPLLILLRTLYAYKKHLLVIIPHIPYYITYFYNNSNNDTNQDVVILVKSTTSHTFVPIPFNFQYACIQINQGCPVNILCTYISPNQTFSLSDLTSLLNQIPKLVILTDNLNSWDTMIKNANDAHFCTSFLQTENFILKNTYPQQMLN